jgi:hypothetical protein
MCSPITSGHWACRINEEDRIRAMRWEHLYWASSADLRDDLMAHSADTEKFWIEYSRRRLIALGISPAIAREVCREGFRSYGLGIQT